MDPQPVRLPIEVRALGLTNMKMKLTTQEDTKNQKIQKNLPYQNIILLMMTNVQTTLLNVIMISDLSLLMHVPSDLRCFPSLIHWKKLMDMFQ